jgi:hypothetical protein
MRRVADGDGATKEPTARKLVTGMISYPESDQFLAALRQARHAAVSITQSLPAAIFSVLEQNRIAFGAGSVEVIVEDVSEIGYLRRLHSAQWSLFYGIGLPRGTVIILDRKHAVRIVAEAPTFVNWRCRSLRHGEDLYLALLWHRFGLAVSIAGEVKDRDLADSLFCLRLEGRRDQWCRVRNPAVNPLPPLGARIEAFGWEKWNSRIIDTLEIRPLPRCR